MYPKLRENSLKEVNIKLKLRRLSVLHAAEASTPKLVS